MLVVGGGGGAFVAPVGLVVVGGFVVFMWLGSLVTGKVLWKLGYGYSSLEQRLFVFFMFLLAEGLATWLGASAVRAILGLAAR